VISVVLSVILTVILTWSSSRATTQTTA